MSDFAVQRLCEPLANFGRGLCDNPKRSQALLSDVCTGLKREVYLLTVAVEHRIVAELLNSSAHVPWPAVSGRLVRRPVDDLAVSEDAARWTIEEWGMA